MVSAHIQKQEATKAASAHYAIQYGGYHNTAGISLAVLLVIILVNEFMSSPSVSHAEHHTFHPDNQTIPVWPNSGGVMEFTPRERKLTISRAIDGERIL
jgi:hypothetical protein